MARSFGGGYYGSSRGWACGAHLAAVMADGTIDKCGYFTALRSGSVQEGLAAVWRACRAGVWSSWIVDARTWPSAAAAAVSRPGARQPARPGPRRVHLRGVRTGGDLCPADAAGLTTTPRR